MGSKESFLEVAEITARLHAAGQDLVERKINGVGGKGDGCWKNDPIRQEGTDSEPRWAAGRPCTRAQMAQLQDAEGSRAVGRCSAGGHGVSLLRVLFFWGDRQPGRQLRRRTRVSREVVSGRVGG